MKYVALTLAVGLSAVAAHAFKRSSTEPGGNVGISWAKRSLTFALNSTGSADVAIDDVEGAVIDSFDVWSVPDCTDLSFSYSGRTTDRSVGFSQGGSNQNIVVWKESGWPHADGVIGVTTVTYCTQKGGICTYNGVILDADVEMNGQEFKFSTNGDRRLFDIGNTLTHEAGHFIGLDHSPVRDSTMFASAPAGETAKRSLQQDDIDGVCTIYPRGAATPGAAGSGSSGGNSSKSDDGDGYLCSAAPSNGAPGLGAFVLLGLLGLSRRRRS